ncbi:hypothetical protein [Ectopseudomonas mendocina]|uniref:hypothetical protein n=1 Tax=Ectopseudomonas mendocina TaxID=300 RepID=UPI00131A4A62|nr:hypothetical protein [Pseudomonas mendocina]
MLMRNYHPQAENLGKIGIRMVDCLGTLKTSENIRRLGFIEVVYFLSRGLRVYKNTGVKPV